MPKRFVVVNTSPMLYLHQVGELNLLQKLYETVHTPNAVIQELAAGQVQGIDVPTLAEIPWIQDVALPKTDLIPNVTDLGQGEAEVIAAGLIQPNSLLIIDDALGRKIAALYDLQYTGTLGVLIKSKQLGHIDSLQPIIKKLKSLGMWLSDALVLQALQSVGE